MKNYLNQIKLGIKIGFMVLMGFFVFEANAQIVQASSVNEIQTYTSQFDGENTLVLFDLDYVLFVPRDSVLRCGRERQLSFKTPQSHL